MRMCRGPHLAAICPLGVAGDVSVAGVEGPAGTAMSGFGFVGGVAGVCTDGCGGLCGVFGCEPASWACSSSMVSLNFLIAWSHRTPAKYR